jgi:hypothetical protein
MAKFNEFIYDSGVLYGEKSRLALSAEPIVATALNYGEVGITYAIPSGTYTAFRLVRNQDSFPETEEDGVVIAEKFQGVDNPLETEIVDTDANGTAPLVEGRYAYYRAWILENTTSYWVPAGDAVVLVPRKNSLTLGTEAVQSVYGDVNVTSDEYLNPSSIISSTHQRFMDVLPRVLTSATNNPVDEINDPESTADGENTIISKFLSAFSFTVDEMFTNISLINPGPSDSTSPNLVNLLSHSFGVTEDNDVLSKAQKRLNREAVFTYKRKGTKSGLGTFCESATGFNPVITYTNNLLLSIEDSTFLMPYWSDGVIEEVSADQVGNWVPSDSSITLSVLPGEAVPTGIAKSLDDNFVCKVVTTSTNKSMRLGRELPVVYGVPVIGGQAYSFSAYIKKISGLTANTNFYIDWYDRSGGFISQVASSNNLADTSWGRATFENQTAPSNAVYAGFSIRFSVVGTFYVDMVQFEKSATATEYAEPRAVEVFLEPTKTNLVTNPTFELASSGSFDGWSTSNASTSSEYAITSTSAFSGNYIARVIAAGSPGSTNSNFGITSDSIDVAEKTTYTGSIYVKDFDSGLDYKMVLDFFDEDEEITATYVGETISIATSYWTRLSVSGYAPSGTTYSTIRVVSTVDATSGTGVYFDSAQFEIGDKPTSYFDGSKSSAGAAWAGDVGDSVSYFYPNRDLKVTRLGNEIKNMLPLGTPYYIDFYGIENVSGTFSGIA